MIQNLIALTIVFSAVGFTLFSIIKNLTAKNASHCGGCSGCSLKELPMAKTAKILDTRDFTSHKNMLLKQGK